MNRGWGKIVVVAGGPSFTQEQAALIVDARANDLCHVIVVNRAWERVPNADVLYAPDADFWDTYVGAIGDRFCKYTGHKESARKYGIEKLRAKANPGMEFDSSTKIVTGINGGQQALNLAVHIGGRNIPIVGFDMKGDTRNWHDPYPTEWMNREHNYPRWIADMNVAAEQLHAHGIDVINCSPGSALTCFRSLPLAEALQL